jgi:DNA-binding PadR family transcriptional regulator
LRGLRRSEPSSNIYVLTPSGLEARARLAKRFLQRKLREYDELVAEIERLKQEAGEE